MHYYTIFLDLCGTWKALDSSELIVFHVVVCLQTVATNSENLCFVIFSGGKCIICLLFAFHLRGSRVFFFFVFCPTTPTHPAYTPNMAINWSYPHPPCTPGYIPFSDPAPPDPTSPPHFPDLQGIVGALRSRPLREACMLRTIGVKHPNT